MCALGWTRSSHLIGKIAYNCGCVLIAKKSVLTAAHCSSFGGEPPFVVRLGGADLDEKRDNKNLENHITSPLRCRIVLQRYCNNQVGQKIQGDSGGPLLMKLPSGDTVIPYVVSLTSFGQGCANGRPSVYTRLSNYIDWIEQVVW